MSSHGHTGRRGKGKHVANGKVTWRVRLRGHGCVSEPPWWFYPAICFTQDTHAGGVRLFKWPVRTRALTTSPIPLKKLQSGRASSSSLTLLLTPLIFLLRVAGCVKRTSRAPKEGALGPDRGPAPPKPPPITSIATHTAISPAIAAASPSGFRFTPLLELFNFFDDLSLKLSLISHVSFSVLPNAGGSAPAAALHAAGVSRGCRVPGGRYVSGVARTSSGSLPGRLGLCRFASGLASTQSFAHCSAR